MIKTLMILLLTITTYAQTLTTNSRLKIKHGDITLYLTKDTCSLVSKHKISYLEFLKLDKDRDDRWFRDTYKGKYYKEPYIRSGYDLGHLTPSHITSYDNVLNHNAFSLFNQAPQLSGFNRGNWLKLERIIEQTISKYQKDAIIFTGVIYGPNRSYLNNSRIPIPIYFYKVLFIGGKSYAWVGSNTNGLVAELPLADLNKILKENKTGINIK